MVGPPMETAHGATGLAASRQGAVRKSGATVGVGPDFRIAGGGDRLCRRGMAFAPGRPEGRWELD